MGAPYWDWPAVSQNWWSPEASDVFTPTYFGSVLSTDTTNWCVQDGPFASGRGYKVAVLDPDNEAYSNGIHASANCLRRCGEVSSPATSPEDINVRYAATTFSAFRGDTATGTDDQQLVGFHSEGHEVIGGHSACTSDMGNPSISPNDPYFWLHHGLVDKIWWRWQTRCKAFKKSYEGPLTARDPIDPEQTLKATSTQFLDSWGVTVAQMLDTQGDTLCYTYSNSKGDLPMPPITCPNFNGVADPGVSPDPTVFGAAPLANVAGAAVAAAGGGAGGSVLDQLVKSMVAVGLDTVNQGTVVFGRRDAVAVAVNHTIETLDTTTTGTGASATSPTETTAAVTRVENTTSTQSAFGNGTAVTTTAATAFSSTATTTATTGSFNSTVAINNTTATTNTTDEQPPPLPHYEITANDDNTVNVTFITVNQTITVPENQTVHWVYQSYVETVDTEGNIARQYLEVEEIPYKRIPGAPINVPAGHPCYKKHPAVMSDRWIHHHSLNRVKIRNTEARRKENIDKWNVENCGPDPSSP
ncbi:hypothetical protein BDR26DRAFT_869852 [Obelidium mucronatum]|nr:hypothetical protein BDR26DRAFT_869852 [Obelidium mucronatum]